MIPTKKVAWAGLVFLFLCWKSMPVQAQKKLNYPKKESISFHSADSSTRLAFQARMQNRFELLSSSQEDGLPNTQAQFLVRRMRLKSSGQVADPRMRYKLELAFSSNDIDGQIEGNASILLDAYVTYTLLPQLQVRFGQFKLPDNRQRVISSGDLQLVDRSPLNSAFNYDRDAGIMLQFSQEVGPALFIYKGAVSNGEGRNSLGSLPAPEGSRQMPKLAFTQRLEFLPFGNFEDNGSYFEGDLLREENPKLSMGGGYYFNNNAIRTRGQRGSLLFESRDINSFFADFIFKHRGWSIMGEYMNTQSEFPLTLASDGKQRAVSTGSGYMLQAGYAWPSLWELAGRYTEVTPEERVLLFYEPSRELLLGFSKYIRGHRIKIQSDLALLAKDEFAQTNQSFWRWRVQMEMGI